MRMPQLVGCYTDPAGEGGLVRLEDGARFTLPSPTWLTRAQGLVWAACELDESRVASLRPGPEGPDIVSEVVTGGAAGCHLAPSPDARWLALAHYTSGSVALLACAADGRLGDPLDVLAFEGTGVDPERQESPHAHQIVWLDHDTMLVPDLGCDLVRIVGVQDGLLVERGALVLPDGFGPRHLVWRSSGDLTRMAVAGELSGEVSSWVHEPGDWARGWTEVSRSSGTRITGNQPSGLRFRGDHLVLANRGVNTVAFLDWASDGTLALTDEFDCGGEHPRDIVAVDDLVWVANQHSDSVGVLRVTGPAGSRRAQEVARFAVASPACLLF